MEHSKTTLEDLYAKLLIQDEEEGGITIGAEEIRENKVS